MKGVSSSGWLSVAGVVLLVLAVISLLLVGERAVSALWQWYKFYGYETPGIITLGKRTGAVFLGLGSALVLLCFTVMRAAKLADVRAVTLSRWALAIACTSIALYCILAFSPLNVWRP